MTCEGCNRILEAADILAGKCSRCGAPFPGPAGMQNLKSTLTPTGETSSVVDSRQVRSAKHVLEDPDVTQTLNPDRLPPSERSILLASLAATMVPPDGSQSGPDSSLGAEAHLAIRQWAVRMPDHHELTGGPSPDYQLVETIGSGGMGSVWNARQYSIGRTVAIKRIHAEFAHDSEERDRFVSEAVISADLDHPNVVPVFELGKFESKELFYAMQRVGGETWHEIVRGRKRTLSENLEIWQKVADAVAFAHSRGVVHRDIKPKNVMVGTFGEVYLMDWGLAYALPHFIKYSLLRQPSPGVGSPAYMAPEMVDGGHAQISPATDIYLLGAVLFELVTGRPPHSGRNVAECLDNVRKNLIETETLTGRKGALLSLALKAMSTRPSDRFRSVQEFQSAVRRAEAHSESLKLSENANVAFNRAVEFRDRTELERARFGFEEALNRWDGNPDAKAGLEVTNRVLRKTESQPRRTLLAVCVCLVLIFAAVEWGLSTMRHNPLSGAFAGVADGDYRLLLRQGKADEKSLVVRLRNGQIVQVSEGRE